MWHDLVLKSDTTAGRLVLGFLNTCTDHPILSAGFLALMLALACTMWVQTLELRLDAVRALPERPIRLRR